MRRRDEDTGGGTRSPRPPDQGSANVRPPRFSPPIRIFRQAVGTITPEFFARCRNGPRAERAVKVQGRQVSGPQGERRSPIQNVRWFFNDSNGFTDGCF
jgi:hypothetical protein